MTDEEFAELHAEIESRLKSGKQPDMKLSRMCSAWVNEAMRRALLQLMFGNASVYKSSLNKDTAESPDYPQKSPRVHIDVQSCIAPAPKIGENQYKCDCCYGVFNKGWSDEEALQEAVNNFPFMKQEDARIVCDDCYKQIMAREAKEGRGDGLHS